MNSLKGINNMHTSTTTSQTGVALITGLMFLVVLTLLSLSAIKATSLEERMAGNARDQDIAFEAAEAGLRDAMKYIATSGLSPASFGTGCTAGLCANNTTTPVWTTITNANAWTSSQTKVYTGTALTFNGTTAIATQPRYIIELIPNTIAASGDSASIGGGNTGMEAFTYRITSRGWGLTNQTQATLQAAIDY
jgi:type IV pilus assembly protein PilX